MKIVYYNRYILHHLTDLCDELYKLTNGNFYFIETEYLPEMRKNLGYKDESKLRPYCININDSKENLEFALKLSREADIAIIGCGSYRFEEERFLSGNKLTYKVKERLFKKGINTRFREEVKKDMFNKHQKYFDKNLFYLCAGTYTATDLISLGFDKNRIITWGYFPPYRHHNIDEFENKQPNSTFKILWCGRFMSTKVPQIILPALRKIIDCGYDVSLTYLGAIEEQTSKNLVDKYVKKYKLEEYVQFISNVESNKVREIMYSHHILAMTSNYEEGWGAVVSEAMNEGCVIVGSAAAGSIGFLIKEGKNGFVFNYRSVESLFLTLQKAVSLDDDKFLMMATEAYKTIECEWNGKIAARRLYYSSIKYLETGKMEFALSGPFSQAPHIKNMKQLITETSDFNE